MSNLQPDAFLQECLRAACVLEATAPKFGNVHPRASFSDLRFEDFVRSAELAAPWLARAGEIGVGVAVRKAITATRSRIRTNTNLGIALLLAPLAAVDDSQPLDQALARVLGQLTVDDTRHVYEAIRIANPGGLGRAPDQDVHSAPTVDLRTAMQLAAHRDLIAAQYANGFRDVLAGVEDLASWQARCPDLLQSIVGLQLSLLSRHADSLIVRKCGCETATLASEQARAILDLGWPDTSIARHRGTEFDDWLRADGSRRNPGTTADLICAVLFIGLRQRQIALSAGS